MVGYVIADYDGTGLNVVQRDDCLNVFSNDDQAAEAFVRDGGVLIRFPYNFIGNVVDTTRNREILKRATYVVGVQTNNKCGYVQRLTKTSISLTDNLTNAKMLSLSEVTDYVKKVMLQVGNSYYVDFYLKA